jgi:hypothetical protein
VGGGGAAGSFFLIIRYVGSVKLLMLASYAPTSTTVHQNL